MTPEIPSSQPHRVKKKRGYLWIAGIVVLILLVCGILYLYPTVALNRELAAIRQKGEPLTMAEVASPPVPQSQNAAPLYLRAAAAMKGVGYWGLDPTKISAKDAPKFLHQNAQTIQFIRQAAAKPQCRFDIDWKNYVFGPVAPMHHDSQMRSSTRLMAMQASYEARIGNTSQALSDVRCMFLMARHMSLTPDTIADLNASSMDMVAEATLAKVLLSVSVTPAQAHAFEASLPVINWNAAVHQGLLTERACAMEIFNFVRSHPNDQIAKYVDSSGKYWPFWVHWRTTSDWEETYALRLFNEDINLQSNAPFPIPPDYGRRFEQELDHVPMYAVVTIIVAPYPPRNMMMQVNWKETLDLERKIALALTAYHTKYNRYPATLAPAEKLWKSTFPDDPYNGKSFRYKNNGKTFLLYSIGANRVDDGGVFENKRNGSNDFIKDDFVWKNGNSNDSR